ncbi:MAG: hypothetical protein U0N74_09795 [Peptococcaceae bacterium]
MEKSYPYADILDAARPEPPVQHPRMSAHDRAGQFGAFAALVGYERAVGALSARLASGDLAPEDIDAFVEDYFGEVLAQDPLAE